MYDSEMRDYRVVHVLPEKRGIIESVERDPVRPAVYEYDVPERH